MIKKILYVVGYLVAALVVLAVMDGLRTEVHKETRQPLQYQGLAGFSL